MGDTAFPVAVPANPQASWELREAGSLLSQGGSCRGWQPWSGHRGTRDNSSTAAERRLIPSSHKFQSVTPCCSRYKESTLFSGRLTLFAFRNGFWKWLAMILRPISASAPLAFTDKGLWHSQRVLQTQHSSFCLCCYQFSQLWGISFLQMESKQLDSVYLSSAAITQIQTGLSLEHSQGQHVGELHFTAFPWEKIHHEIM